MATAQQHKARKLPGGTHLARIVARQQRRQLPFIDSWDAYEARRLAVAAKGRIGPFQAIELLAARSELAVKDLRARIEAIEAEISGKTTAKAPTPVNKPLRLSLWRAIDDASAASLIQKIEAAHGREIKLSIESPGGEIAAAQRIAAAVERHGQIDATAITKCDSAATLVYAACRRRGAIKNASFYFHLPTMGGEPAKTAGDQRRLDRIARDMATFVAKRSGGKASTFLALMAGKGRVVSALEASELGLLNGVVRRPHVPKKGKAR